MTSRPENSPRLLALGEALIDLIPSGKQPLISTDNLEIQIGGAPLNVSVAFSRLGGTARFCGFLSEDAFGKRIASFMETEGIERTPTAFTSALTRLAVVDQSDAESRFRFYGGDPADSQLSQQDVDAALEHDFDALYCGSLLLANPKSAETQRYAIKRARQRDIPIITDPNPRSILWESAGDMQAACLELIEAARLAKVSRDDLRLIGLDENPTKAIERLSGDGRSIVVTDGPNGCWSRISGEVVHVAGPQGIKSIDSTGAGDAFMGALAVRFTQRGALTIEDLEFASSVGAIATTRHGAIASLPRLDEIPSGRDFRSQV